MPNVHPFRAVQYNRGQGDITTLIAPPYDVLDSAGKARFLAQNPNNIVAIDLPHTPAKELGPASVYNAAASLLASHLNNGTLSRREQPAMFAYRQTTVINNHKIQRSGMTACVDVVPFGPNPKGGGILPHEETFSGPKEDRMALMKATHAQLSPIFGLHPDDSGHATALLHKTMASRAPDLTASPDWGAGTITHEVWTITDPATIRAYQDALANEDIFIADGHHRYTTQLNYLTQLESQGPVPRSHPARRCMMVLVGMSDPGLIIWPTHRVLGGMKDYSIDAFVRAASNDLLFEPLAGDLAHLDNTLNKLSSMGEMRFGLYDFATKRAFIARPGPDDPLQARFPDKPKAWRQLVVAYTQYVLVEQICQAQLNANQPVKWAFPHTIAEVEAIGSGTETGAGGGAGFAQLAIIVRPTPLQAVRDVSRANQLMPQKSTFFYPKLATGLWINPLE
jgi:uncharacterized protein (DUF1015 family)